MRPSVLAVTVLMLEGCTPGVIQPRPGSDPRVFAGAPSCNYEAVGSFSHEPQILRAIEQRGGDAAIHVTQENSPATADRRLQPVFYSGQVVRFTDPKCKV